MRYPVLGTVQSVLHFTLGRHVRSNANSGKNSVVLQSLRENYSLPYPPLSITRYSFIQLSELRQRGANEIAQASKQQQEDNIVAGGFD